MPAGEAFTQRQAADIDRALAIADHEGNLPVSVYVGTLGADSRRQAERLHARLEDASGAVLVAVDPSTRHLEIVTGSYLGHRLDERTCALAALTMTSAFAGGDLAGGIVAGVQMLGDHARGPKVLHTD